MKRRKFISKSLFHQEFIPNEVMVKIFSYNDYTSLNSLRNSCKRFRELLIEGTHLKLIVVKCKFCYELHKENKLLLNTPLKKGVDFYFCIECSKTKVTKCFLCEVYIKKDEKKSHDCSQCKCVKNKFEDSFQWCYDQNYKKKKIKKL